MILSKIKNLKTQNRMLILLVFSLLIILAVVYGVILPKAKYINNTCNQITERRKFLEEQYLKLKNIRENKKDIDSIKNDLGKLDEVFVKHSEDLEFIQTLEAVANKNNVEQIISLEDIDEKLGEYKEIVLEIDLKSNFLNIMDYLIDLEILKYYVNVKSLSISGLRGPLTNNLSDETPSVSSRVSCKIIADTYWK